ncbi:hypothetical protein, partial [Acinetobacter sp.]|uniref:hypothetical protein n=1 Tax=Acinetobacter sp. TaxID=472 RepID=UPI0035B31BC6
HTPHPEPVLSIALKCSARDGQRAASMPHSRIRSLFYSTMEQQDSAVNSPAIMKFIAKFLN